MHNLFITALLVTEMTRNHKFQMMGAGRKSCFSHAKGSQEVAEENEEGVCILWTRECQDRGSEGKRKVAEVFMLYYHLSKNKGWGGIQIMINQNL